MPPDNLEISSSEVKLKLEGNKIVLLDVREPREIVTGIIPGAIHIPLSELRSRYTELVSKLPLVVYCAHGVRSYEAAYFLRSMGYEDAQSLAGGIVQWSITGGPLVRP